MDNMTQRLALFAALALGFAANVALATDIYVDVSGNAATPDGSAAAPFTTLKDAVTAANALVGNSTILVRGGGGRVYEIDGAEDLMTVTVSGLTITSWGADKPVFHLSRDLCVATNSPSIITFAAGADYGWLIYPEQTLPAGYVFADSYDSTGEFKGDYDKKVHFLVDGTVESSVVFPIYEVSAKKTRNVSVDGSGKVTIATTSN